MNARVDHLFASSGRYQMDPAEEERELNQVELDLCTKLRHGHHVLTPGVMLHNICARTKRATGSLSWTSRSRLGPSSTRSCGGRPLRRDSSTITRLLPADTVLRGQDAENRASKGGDDNAGQRTRKGTKPCI